jgi:hypothetical protein
MQGTEKKLRLSGRLPVFLLAFASLFISACERNAAELGQLRAENQALKIEIENLKREVDGGKSPEESTTPVLDLTIDELWTQRFEDSRFRAKQRLDGKTIRLTATVERVDEQSISLTGRTARVGSINVLAKLNPAYARRIHEQLANVERGQEVTMQGSFQFDKMWLEDATFVERSSGKEKVPNPISPTATPADGGPAPAK